MQDSFMKIVQMLPPAIVIGVLVYACFIFYKHYVLIARSLQASLEWIRQTVLTMHEGGEDVRKSGLNKVFQGTILQENWSDFSKTLHEQTIDHGVKGSTKRYRMTSPVSNFFTAASVIDKPLRVNYFKHLPGILTGIGIIGTFTGLLFGLSNFDASSPEVISQSVSLLLAGVRDAFYASAFAITAAMVVTHVEKLFYQRCLTSLDELNDSISRMFEGGVHEEYLAKLAHTAHDPAEQARQVRDELNKALMPLIQGLEKSQQNMADTICEAIAQALSTANNKLSNQIENALQRQVKAPIDALGNQLLNKQAQSADPKQDLARKIVRAQQEQQSVVVEKRSEAA
jgi:hypothetical protein